MQPHFYSKALLELMTYEQNRRAVAALQKDILDIKNQIQQHHRKHRRCDSEIVKNHQVSMLLRSV